MSNSGSNQSNSIPKMSTSQLELHHPGKIVGGHYQIIQQLNGYGLSRTYLAIDLISGNATKCVVKQMSSPASKVEQDIWYKFIQVALLQQKLGKHEQIPQIFAYFTENNQFYLIEEYINGESLEQEIKRQPLNEIQVIALLQDVLRILDFVHKTNVIHRDIKPSHLLRRCQDGKLVMLGFGSVQELALDQPQATRVSAAHTSKIIPPAGGIRYLPHPPKETTTDNDSPEQVNLTCLVGTHGFMPPEQAAGKPDFSSDLYALGKTAIYALTGKPPEELEQKSFPWEQFCSVSPKLTQIINRMVSPQGDRYQAAIDVLQDLQPLFKIGQTVGERYRLTRYLGGRIEFSTFLADNLWQQYQSPCIVKEIKLPYYDLANAPNSEHRFAGELAVWERLSCHPQIPQLWDHFEENESFYLVQEYVKGETLAHKLEHQKQLGEEQVVDLLGQTLSVLAFIHQHRIIHHNLKPSNLLLRDGDSQVMLLDIQIIKDIVTPATANTTKQSAYLPPEQIAGRPTVSSDIYALGMIAVEALTGKSAEQLVSLPQESKIVWQTKVSVNHRLARIIDKMISLDVGKRYQSASQVLKDLSQLPSLSSAKGRKVSNQVQSGTLTDSLPPQRGSWWQPNYLLIALTGIITLLTSIETFFPVLRPFLYWYQGRQLLPQQPEIALISFEKAIDLRYHNAFAWRGRGDALFQLEYFAQALSAYDEAIKLQPDHPQAWRGKGDIFLRWERFAEAIAAYDKALQWQPQNSAILNRKGKALAQLGRYQAALAAQDKVLELEPQNAQAISDRAIALMGLGKYQEALTAFKQAQAIKPQDPRFWQYKAVALQYLNRPQEAIDVYQEALAAYKQIAQVQPQQKQVWLEQGKILNKLGQHQAALAAYERAIAVDANSDRAWLGKGNAWAALGENEQALTAYDRALELRPDSYLAWYYRALVLQDSRPDSTAAKAAYKQALALNPRYYQAWREQGFLLSRNRMYSEAIASFDQALNINPNDYKSWLGRGMVLGILQQTEAALKALEQAQLLQPKDPSVWQQKGTLLAQLSRYREACDAYRQVRRLEPESLSVTEEMRQLRCRLTTN